MKSYYIGLALKIIILAAFVIAFFLFLQTVGYQWLTGSEPKAPAAAPRNILIVLMENWEKTLRADRGAMEQQRTVYAEKLKAVSDRTERAALENELKNLDVKYGESNLALARVTGELKDLAGREKEQSAELVRQADARQRASDELINIKEYWNQYTLRIQNTLLAKASDDAEKVKIRQAFAADHGLDYLVALLADCQALKNTPDTSQNTAADKTTGNASGGTKTNTAAKTDAAAKMNSTTKADTTAKTESIATPDFIDQFDDARLNPRWHWVRENPNRWSLTQKPGSLTIITEYGEIWGQSTGGGNILLAPLARANFQIDVRLTFKPKENWQQAGILIYKSDDSYIKLDYVSDYGKSKIEIARETGGSFENQTIAFSSPTIYLRLLNEDKRCTGWVSTDGVHYTLVGDYLYGIGGNTAAGLFAWNGDASADNIPASFDSFKIEYK